MLVLASFLHPPSSPASPAAPQPLSSPPTAVPRQALTADSRVQSRTTPGQPSPRAAAGSRILASKPPWATAHSRSYGPSFPPPPPPPTSLVISDSIVRHKNRTAVTCCFPGTKVLDTLKQIPWVLSVYPHVRSIIIHEGINDMANQQSELLKNDFIDLFNLLKVCRK